MSNERISDEDMAYHVKLVARVAAAQKAQQKLASLQEEIAATYGAMNSWGSHLAEKYNLGAGDVVNELGEILRKELPR